MFEVDFADHDRDGRALAFTREILRAFALGGADPADRGEEVEVPPVAAELAVGHGGQADRFLLGDECGDRLVLDRAQLVGGQPALTPFGAGIGEPLRSQQTADHVGVVGERSHGSSRGKGGSGLQAEARDVGVAEGDVHDRRVGEEVDALLATFAAEPALFDATERRA